MKKDHKCEESKTCCCYIQALEPDESCPVHGYPYPPRCGECGRFMSFLDLSELDKKRDIEDWGNQ